VREKEREGALTWIEEDRRSDAPEPAQQLVQRTYRARKRKNVSYCHVLRPFPESLGSPCSEIAHVVAVSSLDPCGCRLLLYPAPFKQPRDPGNQKQMDHLLFLDLHAHCQHMFKKSVQEGNAPRSCSARCSGRISLPSLSTFFSRSCYVIRL